MYLVSDKNISKFEIYTHAQFDHSEKVKSVSRKGILYTNINSINPSLN